MAVPSSLLPSRSQKGRSRFAWERRLSPIQNAFCFQRAFSVQNDIHLCLVLVFSLLDFDVSELSYKPLHSWIPTAVKPPPIILCCLGSLLLHWSSHCFGGAQSVFILIKKFILKINCSLCTRLYDTVTLRADFCYVNCNHLHAPPHMLKPYSVGDTCMKIFQGKLLQNWS